MPIIEVNNITKEYRLGQFKSLRQSVVSSFNRLCGRRGAIQPPLKALDNIHFAVEEGEVVGVIGANGAGKSTLLKMLARISTPTRGSVKVHGSVAPLIEVGAGLHPELTGRENIYLNGIILGVKRAEIKKRLDEIVQFAELEEFIDTPVKRYSSGMTIRLGFSIATSVDADILIVDEVLAVGDLAFQRKCFDRMEQMIKRQGKTVLIVGHNIRQMEKICSRMLLLDKGKVLMDGDPTVVSNVFYFNVSEKNEEGTRENSREKIRGIVDSKEIEVLDISLFNGDATNPTRVLEMHKTMRIGVRFEAKVDFRSSNIAISIHTQDFVYIAVASSSAQFDCLNFERGVHYFECHLDDMTIKPGSYALRLGFFDQYNRLVWYSLNLRGFRVKPMDSEFSKTLKSGGLVDLPFKWHFPDAVESVLDHNQQRSCPK